MDSLVTPEWLAAELGAPDLRIADTSYHVPLPGMPPRDARAEFERAHIPGALFMDLAAFADAASPLPSTMPGPAQFASRLGKLGLGDGTRIVLYDDAAHHTAARAWVMLRAFGFTDVAILDGGLARWTAEGRALDTGAVVPRPRHATPRASGIGIRDLAAMRAALDDGSVQIVDARSAARFTGAEPDPRPGVAPGHIPGSRNLPYDRLTGRYGGYSAPEALAGAFHDAGIDLEKPLVATCGSGITASVVAFAAHLLGHDVAVYDGSWSEWGAHPDTPKATGDA